MKRVVTAAVLVPLVLLLIFRGSFAAVLAASAVISGLAAWELMALSEPAGAMPPRPLVLAGIAALFAAAYFDTEMVVWVLLLASLVLFIVCAFRSPLPRVLPDTAASVFCLVYVGLTFITIPLLWAQGDGPSLLLFLFCVVWLGDVAALYVGRSLGQRKLAPRLSPNKSWEGSAASMAASIVIAVVLFYLARQLEDRSIFAIGYSGSVGRWILLAIAVNIAAQVGDLIESAIKRGSGVKDSGGLLPGHGGVLDRIDALLLAAPLLWFVQYTQRFF